MRGGHHSMTKTFYIMRHGQTLFNSLSKIQGFCDSPLTAYGIEQAKVAKEYFNKENISFGSAYSSTLERAEDTLELITDMDYTRLKGLKEWNFGSIEGESESLNPPLPYKDFFVQYGGEEEKEFQSRVAATIEGIAKNDPNDHILIVAHGAVLGQFTKLWMDHAEFEYKVGVSNCAIFKYNYTPNKVFVLKDIIEHDFSHIKHLDTK